MVAIQSDLPLSKLPAGTSIIVVLQYLGAAILLAIAQNIFSTHLTSELKTRLPDLDPAAIIHAGGSAARNIGGVESLPAILEAYSMSITTVFVSHHQLLRRKICLTLCPKYLTTAGAIVGVLCGFCLKWNRMKS